MGQDTTDTNTPKDMLGEIPPEGEEPVLQNNGTEDLPPLRMHATRGPQRLSGQTTPELSASGSTHKRRRSNTGGNRSRSRSPSVKNTETTFDAGSSISSLQDLEDLVDPDILLDKQGFEELDPQVTQASVKDLQTSVSSLPAVNERLSNDDLEDVHAFSDVVKTHKVGGSRDNSIATGEALLETLDEAEDEDDNNNNEDSIPNRIPEVILENMENLELDKEGDEEEKTGSHSVPTA